MRQKVLSVLCAATMLLSNITMISSNAECIPTNPVTLSGDAEVLATGLIYTYELFASNSNGLLCIDGSTRAVTQM